MYNNSMVTNLKDIKGYEGLYKITDTGKVWSEKSKKFLKYDSDRSGYQRVTLTSGNVHKRYMVHRLVYSSFCGDIPQGLFINHKNENKTDNRVENLELVTCQ